jgi:fructose-bisphosphate aldolase class II
VAGLVTLGWEDMRAYVAAAEAEGLPVILQAGPSCRAHTPLPVLGKMFRHLAENASVPVVAHLDHGYTFEECREALDSGFTSLMFDGSRKPLDQNIEETARIAEMAHASRHFLRGRNRLCRLCRRRASAGTDPEEAARFARETGVDAMAISVGNVHLQQDKEGGLDEPRIRAIEALTECRWSSMAAPACLCAAHGAGARLAHLQVQHRHRTAHGLRHRPCVRR